MSMKVTLNSSLEIVKSMDPTNPAVAKLQIDGEDLLTVGADGSVTLVDVSLTENQRLRVVARDLVADGMGDELEERTEQPVIAMPMLAALTRVALIPETALAATGETNFITVNLVRRDSEGANATIVASFTTEADALVAFVPALMTIDEPVMNSGELFSVEVLKDGAGALLPAMRVQLDWAETPSEE